MIDIIHRMAQDLDLVYEDRDQSLDQVIKSLYANFGDIMGIQSHWPPASLAEWSIVGGILRQGAHTYGTDINQWPKSLDFFIGLSDFSVIKRSGLLNHLFAHISKQPEAVLAKYEV